MVSIVIPAYNEEESIANCLDSLVAQKTKTLFEVIVVDNASTDKTSEIVITYKKKLNLILVKEEKKGRGTARATGFSLAKGEIILSIDADTFAPPEWVERMLVRFTDPKVVAVTGPWYINDCSFMTNLIVNHLQKLFALPFRFSYGCYWLTGLNFGIRKEIYIKAGGFDKTLNSHEDEDLTWRVMKLGKIVYADEVYVNTLGRRYKKGFLQGIWDYQKTAFYYYILKDRSKKLEDRR